MLMATKTETPVEKAEKLLPVIDSIWVGTLSGNEAQEVIKEGNLVLHELKQLIEGSEKLDLYLPKLIESLRETIKEAQKEISRCEI